MVLVVSTMTRRIHGLLSTSFSASNTVLIDLLDQQITFTLSAPPPPSDSSSSVGPIVGAIVGVLVVGGGVGFLVYWFKVRVPAAKVIGRVGDGWAVSRSLLGMERLYIGSPRNSQIAMQALDAMGKALAISDEQHFADTWAELSLELHAVQCLYRETARALGEGRVPENELSMLKIASTEHFQRTTEAMLELAGEYGSIGTVPWGKDRIDMRQLYMLARPATIYGGSTEIQGNILSKRLLA